MKYWYHGTPDVRNLEKDGFISRNHSVTYITDLKGYYDIQNRMKQSRENGDEETYHKLIDLVPKFKDIYTFRKPIFLTDVHSVAKTYADPSRSMDYQNAKEHVLKVTLEDGNLVTIVATGDRFRFIDINKVIRGFVNAGVDENKLKEAIEKLIFYQQSKSNIKTDAIAVLGEWFGFDYIDVVGVLDSYHGGSIKSTVRMVFDPKKIKIVKDMSKITESFDEYSNDALTDMIVNLSRFEGNEEAIARVKKELNRRKGITEDKFKGGLADDKTPKDLAKKHDVPVSQIKKQLDKGDDVEMEHTDSKEEAEEIAMDHVYEDPKYYDELDKMEKRREKEMDETRSIIRKLLQEKVDLMVVDETPETVSVLVQYNDRNAGVITVTPSPEEEDILELVDMKFKEGYEEPHIMRDALNGLWPLFPDIKSIIVAPEKESIAFWNRMGFDRISPNYLIANRGH